MSLHKVRNLYFLHVILFYSGGISGIWECYRVGLMYLGISVSTGSSMIVNFYLDVIKSDIGEISEPDSDGGQTCLSLQPLSGMGNVEGISPTPSTDTTPFLV